MSYDAQDIAGRPSQPLPQRELLQPDRAGRYIPERIGAILHTVRTLLGFGRHMVETAPRRAAEETFPTIAVRFGTIRLPAIVAHLQRGILRAMALERVLLARAATGQDVTFFCPPRPPEAADQAPPPPDTATSDTTAGGAAAAAATAAAYDALSAEASPAPPPAAPHVPLRSPRSPRRDNPEFYMPTLEEMEAQVRRRSIGRTMVEICLDLGVVPGFCIGTFWELVLLSIVRFGGNLNGMMREQERRREAYLRESGHTSNWKWWNANREATRKVLGFFIGETPVNPFAVPAMAGAARPP